MSQDQDALIYRQDAEIAFLEINRPDKKNAFNVECWQLLGRYCDRLMRDDQVRALVITGHPESIFSAGVDVTPTDPFIADMFQALQDGDKAGLVEGFKNMQAVVSKLAHLPIPTIAAINGLCYSGAVELAAACDIRVIKEGGGYLPAGSPAGIDAGLRRYGAAFPVNRSGQGQETDFFFPPDYA